MKNNKVRTLVGIGMFSSIAYILMLMNFPFPGFPQFLLVDFSDIPALIAALIFGPVAGILVELIKNILDFIMTGSPTGVPVGHIANFVAGILFVLPSYFVYKKMASKKGMTAALIAGTLSMSILMGVLNYFVFLPAYTIFMGWEAMSAPDARQFIATAILPFNLVKGALITIVFMLLFVRLQTWISKQSQYRNA
ncbi:ECF transporter S component [Peribacillus saganii]|uniref:Riboflavin transporter n=1 Tax=Peribacillus saganii TaxID=2303992 RepID=A0A372LBE2_9BACI|nr:ECF transporter S component [Peribacillus saganii]RFU63143.1 ECF transporter S component [Peribacillus saganii]